MKDPKQKNQKAHKLFQKGPFTSSSGSILDFKIECDTLSDEEIEIIAKIVADHDVFSKVYSVPTGGDRLANALQKYCTPEGDILVVDDVLTTGASMEAKRREVQALHPDEVILGVVIFARDRCPIWIDAVFQMWRQ